MRGRTICAIVAVVSNHNNMMECTHVQSPYYDTVHQNKQEIHIFLKSYSCGDNYKGYKDYHTPGDRHITDTKYHSIATIEPYCNFIINHKAVPLHLHVKINDCGLSPIIMHASPCVTTLCSKTCVNCLRLDYNDRLTTDENTQTVLSLQCTPLTSDNFRLLYMCIAQVQTFLQHHETRKTYGHLVQSLLIWKCVFTFVCIIYIKKYTTFSCLHVMSHKR